jgi:mannan endo-1,4-beta-mannosidase
MKTKALFIVILLVLTSFAVTADARQPNRGQEPVTPGASPEARALLELFYSLSGNYTLSGQHNYPDTRDRNSRFAEAYSGERPAIWSTDMGFAEEGNTDSYLARPDIVKEAIRQHRMGSLITICWHAVPPTADEPVTFRPAGRDRPDSLATIQGQLTDRQFRDVLTPGTVLHERWMAQVDSVACYLKQLEKAGVPVLWRPYHEMNGNWFWWGGRVGEGGTADLYRQLFDRYVNYHKLTNLIWVWNVDRPSLPERKFSNFYPGNEYLDILSLDVYGSDFNQAYYDSIQALSMGKPILFGEVGNPPFPEVLDDQPGWTSWVIWAGMTRNLTKDEYRILYDDPRVLTMADKAYWEVTAPFRKACGLPVLPLVNPYPADFSGTWVLSEEMSELKGQGTTRLAHKIQAWQEMDRLFIKRYYIVEWDNDNIVEEELPLDGEEIISDRRNAPVATRVTWDGPDSTMVIETEVTFTRGDNTRKINSREEWKLSGDRKFLEIRQESSGFGNNPEQNFLVYGREL